MQHLFRPLTVDHKTISVCPAPQLFPWKLWKSAGMQGISKTENSTMTYIYNIVSTFDSQPQAQCIYTCMTRWLVQKKMLLFNNAC